jgi:hypothetical protein
MRRTLRWALYVGALLAHAQAHGQIYTCTAEDGTRIFSDERCGPDAKVVPGFETSKRAPAAKSTTTTTRPAKSQKSASELADLDKKCVAGETRACTEWSLGGGPNLLREQERQSELACEKGSLEACEERYCRDGIDEECRERVLLNAKITGETWYLREQHGQSDGSTQYRIRCLTTGSGAVRDITLVCAALAGPNRCTVSNSQQTFSRFDQAAAGMCKAGAGR